MLNRPSPTAKIAPRANALLRPFLALLQATGLGRAYVIHKTAINPRFVTRRGDIVLPTGGGRPACR